MSQNNQNEQGGLPLLFYILRSAQKRKAFNWEKWDPKTVSSASDLPPYLILGSLEDQGFQILGDGWVGRWTGASESTTFTICYSKSDHRYEMKQSWLGIEGPLGSFSAKTPLEKLILQGLFRTFPTAWDAAAKKRLEREFQLTYFEELSEVATFCGLPDGPFRTIAFPIAVTNLRSARAWLEGLDKSHIPYPTAAKAILINQSINYVEGKAPKWTQDREETFTASFGDSGLPPHSSAVRQIAPDGTAAWTTFRPIYAVFLTLPFAGLVDFLERASSPWGPIRRRNAEELPVSMSPIIIPAGLEHQVSGLPVWDRNRTTRCFWHFSEGESRDGFLKLEATATIEGPSESALVQAEKVAYSIISEIERLISSN